MNFTFSRRFSICSRLLLAVVLALSLGHCRSAPTSVRLQTVDQRVSQLTRHFDQIAFGREYAAPVNRLSRWDGAVEVVMQGLASTHWTQQVQLQVDLLSSLTNREMNLHLQRVDAQQIMLVLDHGSHIDKYLPEMFPEAQLPTSFANSACKSMAFTAPHGTIVSAFVFVSVDQTEGEISACITEELAQSMGLFNDVEGQLDTIFDDRNRLNELTFYDRIMLSTLYDYRLNTGMKRADALPIVSLIIEELLSGVEDPSLHRRNYEKSQG